MTLMDSVAYVEDVDYPFEEWAVDHDIAPPAFCTRCHGHGSVRDVPCPCMIAEAFRRFPAAADAADPVADCEACAGDGGTLNGDLCACLVASFREAHATIAWED